ncbi:DUF1924 domain-containing protein [Accumulibacter sp.]|uniref:DUF1924 domain-containing protein n=1 Tax=Accumulibacter sp. TaxID=2053492 RepID=UPI0025F7017A|nr:DUF1924 domain-containing protein [Accumulibacter sp.]MCM8596999.1 DUF1924 domain-containing protein [Accumulibacter sp.]MCM8626255.1 DUF1924 domain-containing protein [Accumulibacter sp.]MDS4051148.1 DUF1924 domain-containing protein [Accumulibacter sp.]
MKGALHEEIAGARTAPQASHPLAARLAAGLAAGLLAWPLAALAGPRDDLLAGYSSAAKKVDPSFIGFSASRGDSFHRRAFAGGKAETPACASCHSNDPRAAGRTPTGKRIEPMAVSISAARYSDPAKVDKWFRRNCQEVLGRECSAQEKGDWLSFMFSQ